jgi:ABC-2 type transport system permease protein
MSASATTQRRALVQSEAITARATPTIKLMLAASVLLAAGACAATFSAASATGQTFSDTPTIRTAMHTSTVSTMILALLVGLVSATGEFRHGHIDQLLLGSPKRQSLVTAKGVVNGTMGIVFGLLSVLVSATTAWVYFRANNTNIDLSRAIIWKPLLGLAIAAPLCALIGVGIGIAARHQTASIGAALGWILLVEPLAAAGIPRVSRWFPLASALALTSSPDERLTAPVTGGLVLIIYVILAISIATIRFRKYDV